MKMFMKYITLMFLFVLSGCANNIHKESSVKLKEIYVNLNNTAKNQDLSGIISEIEYIPLETNDSSLIGNIDKLIAYNKGYIILDKKRNKIFHFDKDGNFLSNIGALGNAPGEYLHLNDADIDVKNNVLTVIGNIKPLKLIEYSLDGLRMNERVFKNINGERLAIDKLHLVTHQTAPTKRKKGYSLYLSDRYGNLQNKFLQFEKHNDSYKTYNNTFIHYGDTIIYHKHLNDTIYQLVNNNLKVRYVFNFGKATMPPEVKKEFNINIAKYFEESKDFVEGIDIFLETDSYVTASVSYKDYLFNIFYNKETEKLTCISTTTDNMTAIIKEPICTYNNEFISILDPVALFDLKKTFEKYNAEDKWFEYCNDIKIPKNLVSKINSGANPMLIKYRLK